MLELTGKYGTAKVMLDSFGINEEGAISQIYEFINHPAFTNPIAIMPDCHKGKGAVIGFTMRLTDKVIPNVIGVDIGCGMLSANFEHNLFLEMTPEGLDERIREKIPFSKNVHTNKKGFPPTLYTEMNTALTNFCKKFNEFETIKHDPPNVNEEWFKTKCEDIEMDYDRAVNSMGTLGGGNHFIEVGIGNKDNFWITIHSGSRQFGLKIAVYHQRKAGKGNLAYLEGKEMFDYLVDMVVSQTYAKANRAYMLGEIMEIVNFTPFDRISSTHNYINFDDFIIRKGAISSYKDELMIIPFNMEDGILICKGKSNPEWNYSAPHGAGRIDSRTWAKNNLNLDEAKTRMNEKGIYCSTLPLDESKLAYKDPKIIEEAIEPTADIIDRLKPVLCCKGK